MCARVWVAGVRLLCIPAFNIITEALCNCTSEETSACTFGLRLRQVWQKDVMHQLVIKCLLYHTEQHRLRFPLEILVIVSTRVMSQMQQKLLFINVRMSRLEVSPEQMFVVKHPNTKDIRRTD